MLNSLQFVQYWFNLAPASTQTSRPERDCLRKHATNRRRLVEIGVWQGVNSRSFREVMAENGILLAIDPYPRSFFGFRGYGWARRIAHHEVGRVRRGEVLWIEDLGKNAPQREEVRRLLPVDFLFIDGDHSYEGLKEDWEAWHEHVAVGGVVALHDSRNRNGYGSERFTTEVILAHPRFKVLETIDSTTVIERVL